MTYGFYVANEPHPRETGSSITALREYIDELTPAERAAGWTITPLRDEWNPGQRNPVNAIWATVGLAVLLFFAAIVACCTKGC